MKAMKCILLIVACMAMAACGNEMDNYKDKVLEFNARKHKTTSEHLVKDFDITIDSMSVSPFVLQDSIDFVKEDYETRKKPFDESISFEKERIGKLTEAFEKEKQKNGPRSYFAAILKQNIYDAKRNLSKAEENYKILTEQYETSMKSFEGRDPQGVVYNIFWYRIIMKNPLSNVHETASEAAFFTPDGERFVKDVNKKFKEYLISKKQNDKQERGY